MIAQHLKLCLVTNLQDQAFPDYQQFILQAVAGGVTSVQLRAKNQDQSLVRTQALALKKLLDPLNIPLILNDHVEIALQIDAAGVHLGQTDLAPDVARRMLGADKIIGWSIETMAELALANQLTCLSYVAASAIFVSQTKLDCKTYWGLEGLQKLTQSAKHPVVAIGGINAGNIAAVIKSGASGVAIVGAIHHHQNPQIAAAELIKNGWGEKHV